tara:strand:- start:1073 stop:1213 length:141 start_codon:yes stop_codon:yes gene_type:complete
MLKIWNVIAMIIITGIIVKIVYNKIYLSKINEYFITWRLFGRNERT